jgi:hypothetical protein
MLQLLRITSNTNCWVKLLKFMSKFTYSFGKINCILHSKKWVNSLKIWVILLKRLSHSGCIILLKLFSQNFAVQSPFERCYLSYDNMARPCYHNLKNIERALREISRDKLKLPNGANNALRLAKISLPGCILVARMQFSFLDTMSNCLGGAGKYKNNTTLKTSSSVFSSFSIVQVRVRTKSSKSTRIPGL